MPLTRILEKGKRKRIKMGMAASQVRYLALQNRNNTIGLNLMTLANRRTALERDMSRVAKLYNEAMNEKMLKLSTDSGVSYKDLSYDSLMKSSAGVSKLPFIITDANGRAVLDDTELVVNGKNTGYSYKDLAQIITQYKGEVDSDDSEKELPSFFTAINSTSGEANNKYNTTYLLNSNKYNKLRVDLFNKLGFIDIGDFDESSTRIIAYKHPDHDKVYLPKPLTKDSFAEKYEDDGSESSRYWTANGKEHLWIDLDPREVTNKNNIYSALVGYLKTVSQTPEMKYFDAIFKYISENGWVYDETINNPNRPSESRSALQEKLRNNIYYLTEATADSLDEDTPIGYDTKISLNTNIIYDVYDTSAQNAALATYEAEKSDIQAKEKQIDLRMSRLEMEQSAIKTELDSIKSIINDNVNSTFKIFG